MLFESELIRAIESDGISKGRQFMIPITAAAPTVAMAGHGAPGTGSRAEVPVECSSKER